MKQLKVALFALMVLFTFSACSDDDKEEKKDTITGRWEIIKVNALIECSDAAIKERIESNYEDLYDKAYEFLDNGKFKEHYGKTEEGEYTIKNGVITFITQGKGDDKDTESFEYTINGNTLTLKIDMTEECISKYDNGNENSVISKVIITETYTRK